MQQWFHCVRCREDGVTKARQRAMADRLPAGKLASTMAAAKTVCGFMTRRCRHSAHCLPAEPSQVVLDLWHDSLGTTSKPPAHERAPEDVRAVCERMEALTRQPEHTQAAEQYDRDKEAREAREAEQTARRQHANEMDLIESGRKAQKRAWDRNWRDGLRPTAKHPGPPLTRDHYLDLFGGAERAPPFELLQVLGVHAVFAGMDAWQRIDQTYEQKEKMFFGIARRIQRGFGVDWMTPQQIDDEGKTELAWDDKRGPYLAQSGEEENDLPLKWYDGGDSDAWKQRQKEASWQHKERKGQDRAKVNLGSLLKGIGK